MKDACKISLNIEKINYITSHQPVSIAVGIIYSVIVANNIDISINFIF